MTADRPPPRAGLRRAGVISFIVTTALVAAGFVLADAPVWVVVVVAIVAALALAGAYWRDRRRGERWF